MITQADVLEQLEDLDRQRKQAEATLEAIRGAEQVCRHWLVKIQARVEKASAAARAHMEEEAKAEREAVGANGTAEK